MDVRTLYTRGVGVNSTDSHVRMMHVQVRHGAAMVMTINRCAMICCAGARGVLIHSVCMQIAASRQRYETT